MAVRAWTLEGLTIARKNISSDVQISVHTKNRWNYLLSSNGFFYFVAEPKFAPIKGAYKKNAKNALGRKSDFL